MEDHKVSQRLKGFFRRRTRSSTNPAHRPTSPANSAKTFESQQSYDDTNSDVTKTVSHGSTAYSAVSVPDEIPGPPRPTPQLGEDFAADRWTLAWQSLDGKTKLLLEGLGDGKKGSDILSDLVKLGDENGLLAEKDAWKIEFVGRRISVKDVAAKLVSWVRSFKDIGDTLVSIDPVHAALPWAAVKLVMQLVTAEQMQSGAIVLGVERVAFLITTARIYEQLYLDKVQAQNTAQRDVMLKLNDRIVQLYGNILARCVQSVNGGSLANTMRAFFHPGEIADLLSELGDIETKTTTEATLCERYSTKLATKQIHEDSRMTRLQLRELMGHLERNMTTFWKKLDEDERVNILQWVSDIPYETDHYVARKGRVEGTGTWLIDHATFETWRSTNASTILWLNGIPGAGKTKLSSNVVDSLLHMLEEAPEVEGQETHCNTAFAFFYCDRNRADHRDPVAILRSLVRQLCAPTNLSCIESCVETRYKERKLKGFAKDRLVSEECHELLLQLVTSQRETYIVLDGLDECERDTRHVLMEILDDLVKKSSQSVKVYIASRTDQDLRERYQGERTLEITADDNRNDIERFVTEQMKKSDFCSKKMRPDVREKVLAAFRERSQGMFQWAVLQIGELLQLRRNKDILRYLDQLPKGLEAAYDKIHGQISSQLGSKKDIAFTVFKLLMVSWRPLSPDELVIAVVQDPDEEFHIDEDIDIAYLLDACHNLLVVTDESSGVPRASKYGIKPVYAMMDGFKVRELSEDSPDQTRRRSSIYRFSHLSVQEYLEKRWGVEEARVHMLAICLRTLLSLRVSNGSEESETRNEPFEEDDSGSVDSRLVLAISEAQTIKRFHIVADEQDQYSAGGLNDLPTSQHFEYPPFKCLVEDYHIHTHDDAASCISGYFEPFVEGHRGTGLDDWVAYAARGLVEHLSSFDQEGDPPAPVDSLMREFMGEPRSSSSSYRAWTMLNQNGYGTLAARAVRDPTGALDSGVIAPVDFHMLPQLARPRALLRPISSAALGCALLGLDWILESWLDQRLVDHDWTNEQGDSLLILALLRGRHRVCRLLIQLGANVHWRSSWGDTALHIAVSNGMAETVALLLESGVDPELRRPWSPNDCVYPIQQAVHDDNLRIATLLLAHGVDLTMTENHPLVIAARNSNLKMVSLLLKYAPELDIDKAAELINGALDEAPKANHDLAPQVVRLLKGHATEMEQRQVLS